MSNKLVGATTAVFTVMLSVAVDEIVDVNWTTRDGSAKAGVNYEASSGTVEFLPGETVKQIEVLVYGQDDLTAPDKNFFIALSPPSNAVLGMSLLECVIVTDSEDGVAVLSIVMPQGKRGLKGDPGLSAYEQAVLMGYQGTLEDWMAEIADASQSADRAETAAMIATLAGKIYATPADGVNPATGGVPVGSYFNVRSPSGNSMIDEYRNVNGVALPTGKSYPSVGKLNQAIDETEALKDQAAIEADQAEVFAERAEAAATGAAISGNIYQTPAEGVAPVTGVPVGSYFNVRSPSNDSFIDEYQNVGGVATATGKSYPSASVIVKRDEVVRLLEAKCIDLSYLKPPKDFDLSTIIQQSLNMTSIAPINLILPHGEFTLSKPVATPVDSKGVVFNLNGSTLKAQAGYSSSLGYLLDLTSTTMHPVIICNGVLDGSLRSQNLFEVTNPSDLSKGTSGISCKAIDVIFENLVIQHMYGQTTRTFCRNFEITNVFVNDCGGHWYLNDGYDAFGDAFYVGTGFNDNGVINVTFNNVTAKAKYSRQYPENHQAGSVLRQDMYSRIGVTLEKFGGKNSNIVNMSFNNCDFQYFERGIHQEATGITSNIEMENTRFDSAVMFGAYLTDVLNARASKCKFGLYDVNYNGSRGITRSYAGTANVTLDAECIVEQYGTNNANAFGMSGTLTARNTKFKNIQNIWSDSLTVALTDCVVEVSKHSTLTYPAWASSFTLKNTNIKYIGVDATIKSYTQNLNFNLDNVVLDNMLLEVDSKNRDKFKDVTVIADDFGSLNFKGTLFKVKKRNGEIVHYPTLMWGASKNLVENQLYTYQKYQKPTTGTLNIINDAVRNLSARLSLFLIVVKGSNSGNEAINNISDTAYGGGYYVALAKRDTAQPSGIKQITSFAEVGSTVGSGFNVTIDANFNVTEYGTYSTWVHVAVVPVSEKGSLPFVPDSLISIG